MRVRTVVGLFNILASVGALGIFTGITLVTLVVVIALLRIIVATIQRRWLATMVIIPAQLFKHQI